MRFTIRDVLWLTVAVALACGWRMEYVKSCRVRENLQEQISELKELARQPRSVTVGVEKHELPSGMQRAIVEFGKDGSVGVRYEKISD
jgi:hypothetical protein